MIEKQQPKTKSVKDKNFKMSWKQKRKSDICTDKTKQAN